ncbi:methyltransferase domain-containing protein [Myroides odoratus]|uniref:methyltransferase domain-containing protein n=1 Tax=Myroides odoratus TaxID=256 RepID=UPI0039AFFF45
MRDIESKLKILNKLFVKYSDKSDVYFHAEYLHKDVRSAEIILALVHELLTVNSAVDVGCGLGAWLSVLMNQGIDDVLGIDGKHLPLDKILIPSEKILLNDLDVSFPKITRRYDLAICLEVAEHLKPESAEKLVRYLTDVSDTILFSAAVPYQGGINHINEQWIEFWQEKFEVLDFEYHDCIREYIWNNNQVKWWYKQNCFIIAKKGLYPTLKKKEILNIIHPELFLQYRILDIK